MQRRRRRCIGGWLAGSRLWRNEVLPQRQSGTHHQQPKAAVNRHLEPCGSALTYQRVGQDGRTTAQTPTARPDQCDTAQAYAAAEVPLGVVTLSAVQTVKRRHMTRGMDRPQMSAVLTNHNIKIQGQGLVTLDTRRVHTRGTLEQ